MQCIPNYFVNFSQISSQCPINFLRISEAFAEGLRISQNYIDTKSRFSRSQASRESRWNAWKSMAKQDWLSSPLLRYAHHRWGGLDPCSLAVLAEIELPQDPIAAKTALRHVEDGYIEAKRLWRRRQAAGRSVLKNSTCRQNEQVR